MTATDLPDLKKHIRDAVPDVSPFLVHFARFGFVARGIVYLIIGLFAGLAPIGMAHAPVGTRGALAALLDQPVGDLLLAVVALGFVSFGVWQLMLAIENPEHAAGGWEGVRLRVVWAWNALVYFAMVALAINVMIAPHYAGGDEKEVHDWTAAAMRYPFGRWMIAGIGVGILCFGVLQLLAGWRGKLDPRLAIDDLGAPAARWLRKVARFGVAARGLVFGLLGLLLVRAAYNVNAGQAHGIGGTLVQISRHAYGAILLSISAVGLIAFGLYNFVLARYRRIKV